MRKHNENISRLNFSPMNRLTSDLAQGFDCLMFKEAFCKFQRKIMIKSAREIQLSVSTDIFGFPLRRDSHNSMNSSTVHYAVLADSNV